MSCVIATFCNSAQKKHNENRNPRSEHYKKQLPRTTMMKAKTILQIITYPALAYTFVPSGNLTSHCKNPDAFDNEDLCFIAEFAPLIKEGASTHNLPPELIAAVLYQENDYRLFMHDLADSLSAVFGRNHSAGPAQMNTLTAANLDGIETLTLDEIKVYHRRLRNPEQAITYLTLELTRLRDQTPIQTLNLAGVDKLVSQYMTNLQPTDPVNYYGELVLEAMRDINFAALMDINPTFQPKEINEYLKRTQEQRVD